MNDDELERSIATALHEYFPEPTGSQPRLPDERVRRWPQVAAVTGSVAVIAAAGITISLVDAEAPGRTPVVLHGGDGAQVAPTATKSAPSVNPTRSTISSAPPAVPPWVSRCLPTRAHRLGPAPEYLGLSFRQAWRLAERRGEAIILAGAGGRCDHSSDAVFHTREIALVFDEHFFRRHPNRHRDPRNPRARIIAAVHATPGWDGANR